MSWPPVVSTPRVAVTLPSSRSMGPGGPSCGVRRSRGLGTSTTRRRRRSILHAWTVIKFDGASGAELWRQATDASNDSIFPAAQAVAVDGAANVVAVGITNPGARPTFMVIKYDGVSGFELWRRRRVNGRTRFALDRLNRSAHAVFRHVSADFGAQPLCHECPGSLQKRRRLLAVHECAARRGCRARCAR